MTDRIERMLQDIRNGEHHKFRKEANYRPVKELADCNMPPEERVTERLIEVLEAETPVILPEQKILFLRTVKNLPEIYTEEEWENIKADHFIHELGRVCNISPDYERVIQNGLEAEKLKCLISLKSATESETRFLNCIIRSIDAVYNLTKRYRIAALEAGNAEAAEIMKRVPRIGARTFKEALQFFRIVHYVLWCEGEYHNTVGRFDQYMFPYLKADLEAGRLNEGEAFELLEEFFLTFNLDSDLYPGVQQGDNGQSIMLGGADKNGKESFNLLSSMCLNASGELKVIDPKINLRVNKNTPIVIFEQGTRLTKAGLGFPQYSNDDIVIEGLLKKGYSLEDARDYTVAACWEFIIPKVGMDIPNIGAVNFPKLVNDTVAENLIKCGDYSCLYRCFRNKLRIECSEINEKIHSLYMIPAPFMSLMMSGCIEQKKDISLGSKYNNFGFHGVGISTAVDSLAVIKKCIYDERTLTKEDAIKIIAGNSDEDELLTRLRYEEPKFGDGTALTDEIAVQLFQDFGNAVSGLLNELGGCIRAGTGSAMFYLWYADNVINTLSGHRKGDAFSANYAPELFVRNKGPLSAIASLTKPDFTNVINGGPMTMEFHSSVFRGEDGIHKVAGLVQQFVRHGGHQLQLNSVNMETLLDAQKEPEKYKNLIVRIWGWSAYFIELDKEYQDHVIARQEFQV